MLRATSWDSLADDLDRGRTLLREARDLSADRRRGAAALALEAIAVAPTLATAARDLLRSLSPSLRVLVERFIGEPLSAISCRGVALELMDRRAYPAALRFLLRAEEIERVMPSPLGTTLGRDIGLCLTAIGHDEQAIRRLRMAALGREDFGAHACIGHTLLGLGRMSEANRAFGRALQEPAPDGALAHVIALNRGRQRLLEFEGQAGLDARDLHYVTASGLVLELAGEEVGAVIGSGYHGQVMIDEAVAARLVWLASALLPTMPRQPTCVVPLNNRASAVSLAMSVILDVPHLSARRIVAWDRPLVVGNRFDAASRAEWRDFLRRLPPGAISLALSCDWTAEETAFIDLIGVMASTTTVPWEGRPHPAARRILRGLERVGPSDLAQASALTWYYALHRHHRLAQQSERGLNPHQRAAA